MKIWSILNSAGWSVGFLEHWWQIGKVETEMPSEKIRQNILDAAERAIYDNGLSEVRMEDIAKEAGISKGGIFYHFPSKRELLLASTQSIL